MNLVSIVGARPQFVKAAVLVPELVRIGCNHSLVHTGQHYDYAMSQVFFDQLDLPAPDFLLDVGSASHAVQTAEMMRRLEPALHDLRPHCAIVYGDTNSTLAGALTAAKMNIPVAHVEAGLRSFDPEMPEELNRVVADHVSRMHFAPTQAAADQLAREGITSNVHVVGDVMVDLVKRTAVTLPARPAVLDRFELSCRGYAVATVHRASNTADLASFGRVIGGLQRLPMPVIFPVHPRTAALAQTLGLHGATAAAGNIIAIEPLSYMDMIGLMSHARVIVTDSGGIQKEAMMLGVPCVTLRDTTEWPETVAGGWNRLVGTDPNAIEKAASEPPPTGEPPQCYGDGRSAERIAALFARELTASFARTVSVRA